MGLIFRIAWRNIFRHKGKTLVIGFILFLGSLVLTVGNGIITGLNEGLQKNVVEGFSGDVILAADKQINESVLASMSGQTLESITAYPTLKPKLLALPYIQKILPVVVGYVWVLNESGQPVDHYLLGVNFNAYRNFYGENLAVLEGSYPDAGQQGVLLSSTIRERIYDFSGFWAIPKGQALNTHHLSPAARQDGDKLRLSQQLVFLGLSQKNASLDIPSEVLGVFKFKELNKLLGFYSLLDIESLRECVGYFNAETKKVAPTTAQSKLLEAEAGTLEESFDFDTGATLSGGKPLSKELFTVQKTVSKTPAANWEDGTFNAIMVKLKPGYSPKEAVKELTAFFKSERIPLKAIRWSQAIGMLGQMALIMKGALLVFVSFIFFVAVIIIMNTLSIAAMERITEIGMMRAVGAPRAFVSNMFVAETGILAAFFGGLGILAGSLLVRLLAMLHLSTQNEILQIFYGGDTFQPRLDLVDLLLCAILLCFVTFLAVLYPVSVARKITPLDAMSRD